MTVKPLRLLATVAGIALVVAVVHAIAPFENNVPNVINTAADVTATLGATTVINHGLQGVGRISASDVDNFAESVGAPSGMQITEWVRRHDGSYSGTLNILPDRGYNIGDFYSDYGARINRVDFHFTPYTGAAPIGGVTDLEQLQAQNQIEFDLPVYGQKFKYYDPYTQTLSETTGLDPGPNSATLFGKTLPYVSTFTGPIIPTNTAQETFTINKLPLDSEALVLRRDGSGYIGDEYGANIYFFNRHKQIVGVITPPPAMQPHAPAGILNFTSKATTPADGRRNNQGFEGVALSPSGKRLFALLQSAAVQDADAANNQRAKNTRLLIYDITSDPTPDAPIAAYALVLPTLRSTGDGGAVNLTAAQSELVALDDTRFLVLSRDGNGLGRTAVAGAALLPSVFKSILLVDITVGAPTNFVADAARNAAGGKITSASGVLAGDITPLTWVEAVNLLNSAQLSKFNVRLDTGGQVSKLTLGEKWEGMSLVSARDPKRPNDYFLFVGNDSDFLTSDGRMKSPNGNIINYDGFNGYLATRIPPALDSIHHENDILLLVYRLTIESADPDGQMFGAGKVGSGHFAFRVRQTHNEEYGRFEFWVPMPWFGKHDFEPCRGDNDHDYGKNHGYTASHFIATSIDGVTFSDDPGFKPQNGGWWAPVPKSDTVRFSGLGKWKGQPGYSFVLTATDRGEPGKNRDAVSIVIKDPLGVIVTSFSGLLGDGNIQSTRLWHDQ